MWHEAIPGNATLFERFQLMKNSTHLKAQQSVYRIERRLGIGALSAIELQALALALLDTYEAIDWIALRAIALPISLPGMSRARSIAWMHAQGRSYIGPASPLP
jgi:hypothetical protein